eukprot:jgi/Phyca11/529388/estExt2_fgenesh1_pm.C_PHYCAscaffold_420083
MHTRVEALLAVVKDQQTQYNQAAELLNARVAKYLATQQVTKKNESVEQVTRGSELQSLQSELLELKSAVIDSYLQPKVVNKVVEVVKEIPIVLRPAEATVAERLSQGTGVDVRDQTSLSSEEITKLFERG